MEPNQYQRDLMVAAWHTITEHPEHWDQSVWACGTGFCLAGWVVVLDGRTVLDLDYVVTVDGEGLYGQTIESIAIDLLGFCMLEVTSASRPVPVGGLSLFSESTTLGDLQKALTAVLGEDPAGLVPRDDLMLRGKLAVYDLDEPSEEMRQERLEKFRAGPRFGDYRVDLDGCSWGLE